MKKALNKTLYFSETKTPEYVQHDEFFIKGFFGKYRFLSNFYDCPNGIWYEGLKYPSTEHAYQAAKAESKDREKFIGCNVFNLKRLGNSLSIDTQDWDAKKYNVMIQLVSIKFATHDDFRDRLINTGSAHLEETNHWNDKTWGVCKGVGTNWLGQILMTVRSFWSNKTNG